MRIVKKILVITIGLMFSSICSAVPLKDIEKKVEKQEIEIASSIEDILKEAKQIDFKEKQLEVSLTEFKKHITTLSKPLAKLNQIEDYIKFIQNLLKYNEKEIKQFESNEVSLQSKIDDCKNRTNILLDKLVKVRRNSPIKDLSNQLSSLKKDSRYIKLITSDLDVFGLSKNITLQQSVGNSCSINTLFNYLRNCSKEELEMIRKKSSKQAAVAIDNLLKHSGNPSDLQEIINNGWLTDCLWGMALSKFNLVPYDNFFNISPQNPNIMQGGLDPSKITPDFKLVLGSKIQYKLDKLQSFDFEKMQEIVNKLPNGSYFVSTCTHCIFLKKTESEIIVHNSGFGANFIGEEKFGFSYIDKEAIDHLVEVSNQATSWGFPIDKYIEFEIITINPNG